MTIAFQLKLRGRFKLHFIWINIWNIFEEYDTLSSNPIRQQPSREIKNAFCGTFQAIADKKTTTILSGKQWDKVFYINKCGKK